MKYRNLFIGKTGMVAIVLLVGGIVAGCFVPTKADQVENLIYADIHNNIQKRHKTQDLTKMQNFYSKYPRALDRYIAEHVADSTAYADDLHAAVCVVVKDNPNISPKQILNKLNNVTCSNDITDTSEHKILILRRNRDIVRDISISLDMARRVKTDIQR